ncbi:chromosome partitioning protein ParA [Deinococcus malanensis]|uniref:Chromosome partitioning protein ParA n=1 Tax=Deinococcus malanensis TaxID=1706855 RepID=A0ABQ2EZR7_9DEIO|nr:ParA family protein [Deinococcus malanensis]GGK34282.1 chromosome partitioning protein ParA [Deinococcus malanensis]
MRVLNFFNHVGGAGKTSISYALGYEFARRGQRVLMVDLDPQASLTKALGLRVTASELSRTVHDTAVSRAPLPEPDHVHGLAVIPSHVNLTLAEGRMMGVPGVHMNLHSRLRELSEHYDLVLIDSPPSLGQLTILGALAADQLVVPLPCQDKGIEGLDGLAQAMELYHRVRPELTIALYVPTLYDRRVGHDQDTLTYLKEKLSPLATEIPLRSVWRDAWRARQPVGLFAPNSPVDQAVRHLADELTQAARLPEVARG